MARLGFGVKFHFSIVCIDFFSALFVTVFVQYNSFDSSVTHKRSFLLLHSTGADLGDLLGDRGSGAAEGSGFSLACNQATARLRMEFEQGAFRRKSTLLSVTM